MGRLDGKVAVISGAARGQGRAHADTLAREGASIVAFDLCDGFEYTLQPPSTEDDLQETVRVVEGHGQRCLAVKADARDLPSLQELADRAMDEFGRIDVLLANHGIWTNAANTWTLEEASWQETIDVILTGVWKVCSAFVPKIIEGERGGAVVLTGSVNCVQPQPGAVAYTAAKHGVLGIMKVLAVELGQHNIRVNIVNPGAIDSPMLLGGTIEKSLEHYPEHFGFNRNLLPDSAMVMSGLGASQPSSSVSDAIVWLVSDEAKYVTGTMIPVDAGWTAR
jgi:SDR family mycofactocin-dependent oxidoreductase